MSTDFPIAEQFNSLCTRVFRVEAFWNNKNLQATAFLVERKPGVVFLATAKHVSDVPKDRAVIWRFRQFDSNSRLKRELGFRMAPQQKGGNLFHRHKRADAAFCMLDENILGTNGDPFFCSDDRPLPTISRDAILSTGTRICWAGFPVVIEELTQAPALCCSEGSIVTTVNRKDLHLYVADGFFARGFSGGPVWYWSREKQQFQVAGIVARFKANEAGLPPVPLFEPINYVTARIELLWKERSPEQQPVDLGPGQLTEPIDSGTLAALEATKPAAGEPVGATRETHDGE